MQILSALEQGDSQAAAELLPLVYDELRRWPRQRLAHERPGQTLQATALVHEAYLRLIGDDPGRSWHGPRHFFKAAAEAMRRIFVDRARGKASLRAGGSLKRLDLDDFPADALDRPDLSLDLDSALTELESHDETAAATGQAPLLRRDEPSGGSRCAWHRPSRRRSTLGPRPRLAAATNGRALKVFFHLSRAEGARFSLCMVASTAFHRGGYMADWDPSVNEIFLRAIEAGSPSERAAVLDRSCGGDLDLRRKVEALLLVHDGAGSFLERPAPGVESARSATSGEGATLPRWKPGRQASGSARKRSHLAQARLLAPSRSPAHLPKAPVLGSDRTSCCSRSARAAWASSTWPSRRRPSVARSRSRSSSPAWTPARSSPDSRPRRQALALMDHPNIAKVFDAGATGTGRPFFVMELVNGVPITEYCDGARLTPRERLELFVPVCRAIQHAHQKGVIHRDVKPSNVLVTVVDGRPTPKVIDFGVAKATGQALTERSLFTQFGAIVGTLEYMSPEQAELSSQDVDTRSDVFSLGVLLYELLTGSTPLQRAPLREAGYAEILRRIREEEPPRPSTRLSDSGEALASIAVRRHTEPAKLTRLVRGELDWIVMKALEKDRTRRYESASGFAQDVERYLAHEAVEACPPSRRYRLGKFVGKHREALATALLFAAVLVAAAAISAWLAIRAEPGPQGGAGATASGPGRARPGPQGGGSGQVEPGQSRDGGRPGQEIGGRVASGSRVLSEPGGRRGPPRRPGGGPGV